MKTKHGIPRRSRWVWLALGLAWTGCGPSKTLNTAGGLQTPTESAPPRPVGDFLLLRKDGEQLEGRDGTLTADRLTGTTAAGRRIDILRDDIQTLYRKEGSRAGTGALVGAGLGLLTSTAILLQASSEDARPFRDGNSLAVSAGIAGGCTLLGTFIGLAIGAGSSRWSVEPLVMPGEEYAVHVSMSL